MSMLPTMASMFAKPGANGDATPGGLLGFVGKLERAIANTEGAASTSLATQQAILDELRAMNAKLERIAQHVATADATECAAERTADAAAAG